MKNNASHCSCDNKHLPPIKRERTEEAVHISIVNWADKFTLCLFILFIVSTLAWALTETEGFLSFSLQGCGLVRFTGPLHQGNVISLLGQGPGQVSHCCKQCVRASVRVFVCVRLSGPCDGWWRWANQYKGPVTAATSQFASACRYCQSAGGDRGVREREKIMIRWKGGWEEWIGRCWNKWGDVEKDRHWLAAGDR